MANLPAHNAILQLLAQRDTGKTICPSEAARALASERGAPDDWRAEMEHVHAAARELATQGAVSLTQSGDAVAEPTGAYRIAHLPKADRSS